MLGTRGLEVSVREDPEACLLCTGPMVVQKSVHRHAATLEHGAVEIRETVHVCKDRCRHPSGALVTQRARALADRIPPGGVVGYDVLVQVGIERFVHHRQREEIRLALGAEHGVEISTGEVSTLAVRFLGYLQALHEESAPALREALEADGGWPLHVDATGEDGRGTLLVAFAGWRSWALGAWKIPTERADAVLPPLEEVVRRFGVPCAVMRDLGRAMIPAVDDLVAGLGAPIPVLSCHRHFLADIGGDLLDATHGELRSLFRQAKVRPGLRSLARDLGRKIGEDIAEAREALRRWQAADPGEHRIPEGRNGLAVVRGLVQWVLDFQADSVYRSFPFDRPYLDLYERCHQGRRAADAYRRCPPEDRPVRSALARFGRVLDPILDDPDAAQAVTTLRGRAALFDELRDLLRIRPPLAASAPAGGGETPAELDELRNELDRWVRSLHERRPERGPAQDTRAAIDLVLEHIDRHGDSLWGHAIELPSHAGGGIRLVERTNNIEENFFGGIKRGERRRSGRKVLTQDLEHLPAAAALACNLAKPDYVAILCGSLEDLPAAFAQLDAHRRDAQLAGRPAPIAGPHPPSIVASASLPTADRRIVRSEAMNRRVLRAARSRAPRRRVG